MLIPILKQVKEPHIRMKFLAVNTMYQNNYCIEIRADSEVELIDKIQSNLSSQLTNQFNCFLQDNKDYLDQYEFIEDKDNINYLWDALSQAIELREDAKEDYLMRIVGLFIENKGRIFKAVTLPDNITSATELQLKERYQLRLSYYITLINLCIDFSSNGFKKYLNVL